MSDIYRDSIFWVEVERIKPNPFQPRREFDQAKLQELADSIRMYGLLQPLTVTRTELPREDGGLAVEYELIAGERRLRASKLAGLAQVPVIIRSGEETDLMKLELAIIENLQREDLNAIDRAKAFHKLHHEFGFSHTDIGRKIGRSREFVSNTVRLLGLPEEIQGYVAEGRVTEGHTRPLMMLNDRPEEQMVLVKEILLKKLTVRETEAVARRAAQDKVTNKYKINPEILSLERAFTEKLGTRVQIETREVGGRLVISFFSSEDLQALLQSMQVDQATRSLDSAFNGPTETNEVPVVDDASGEPAVEPQSALTEEERVYANDAGTEDDAAVADGLAGSDEAPVAAEPIPQQADSATLAAPEEPERPQPAEVAPDPTRPQPEPVAPEPAPAPPAEVVPPAPATPEPEPEEDLYSIRNFSI